MREKLLSVYRIFNLKNVYCEPSAYLDIETIKVEAKQPWHQKTRWRTFMVGMGFFVGKAFEVEIFATDDEDRLIDIVESYILGRNVKYMATREFDEMVLRGRFTNARRAHSPYPGKWPNLDGCDVRWENLRKVWKQSIRESRMELKIKRSPDIESRLAPEYWISGEDDRLLVKHNLRDVVQLPLMDPSITLEEKDRKTLCDVLVK